MSAQSYNGWSASKESRDFGGLDNREVASAPGVRLAPGVRAGDVADVLRYVAEQLHLRVEAGVMPGCWGFNFRPNRNANNLSCHASATAFDWNAPRHPNGKHGTFTAAQVRTIRAILAEVGGAVKWGGDFSGTKDEMHFEIHATGARVAEMARMVRAHYAARQAPPAPTPAPAPVVTPPPPVQEDDMATLITVLPDDKQTGSQYLGVGGVITPLDPADHPERFPADKICPLVLSAGTVARMLRAQGTPVELVVKLLGTQGS